MSIFTGKAAPNGTREVYNSTKLWNQRSAKALNGDAKLYEYDSRLTSDDAILAWLKQQLVAGSASPHLLEIGAGFGRWAAGLQGLYASFTGVDIVEARVGQATKLHAHRPNVSFQLVEGEWYLGKTFDVVISVTVLQHLLMPEAAVLLRAIERHLAPDGVALLAEWRVFDVSLREAEEFYADERCASHMIPKPLQMLKAYAPSLDWSGENGKFILRRK